MPLQKIIIDFVSKNILLLVNRISHGYGVTKC